MGTSRRLLLAVCASLQAIVGVPSASLTAAETVDRLTLIVGYEAGGGYDIYARFIVPFLSRYLPNNPRIIVQNMPGAGGLRAANYLYKVAPRDGSVIGTVNQSIGLMELLGQPGISYESDKFTWLGRIADVRTVLGFWHTSKVASIEDARTTSATIAVGGPISGSTLYVLFLNASVGTKFRPVTGYNSRETMLAMERGELDGSATILYSTLESTYPTWLSEKKINLVVQLGTERHENLMHVPLFSELATTPEDRQIFEAVASSDLIGRSLLAPPGVTEARATELRTALAKALRDPEATALARSRKLDLGPMEGLELQGLVERTKRLSPPLVARIQTILQSQPK